MFSLQIAQLRVTALNAYCVRLHRLCVYALLRLNIENAISIGQRMRNLCDRRFLQNALVKALFAFDQKCDGDTPRAQWRKHDSPKR